MRALERALAPRLANREDVSFVRCGSLFWLYFGRGAVPRASHTFDDTIAARFRGIFHRLLANGIYYPPSAYEAGFLSLAHSEGDVDRFAGAVGTALEDAA